MVRRRVWAAAALGALAGAAPAAAFECRAAIVLALDLSSSVDAGERRLQFQGVAAALTDPEVRDLILTPPGAGIAAAAFTWSGVAGQEVIAPWTALDSDAAIDAFAALIGAATGASRQNSTALGVALGYAAQLHASNPIACRRRIVDMAGDGVTNDSLAPNQVRRLGLLDGLEINGLVIRGATPDPLDYYGRFVIQGPDAFVLGVETYDDYASAMRKKLIRELRPDFAALAP